MSSVRRQKYDTNRKDASNISPFIIGMNGRVVSSGRVQLDLYVSYVVQPELDRNIH